MAEYPEGLLRDDLSLYDQPVMGAASVTLAIEDIAYFMDGNGDMSPLSGVLIAQSIYNAAMNHFGYWILASREPRAAALDLAQRIKFLMMSAEEVEFNANPDFLTPYLDTYGETLLQLVATGRDDLAGATEEIARRVLATGRYAKPADSGGYFGAPAKLGVFALEMLAARRGETIDWESFHVPPDRFWRDCARIGLTEPDPVKAAEWATQLCDAHMQTLRTDRDGMSTTPFEGKEINQQAHFLWPITTHAFLRLRAGQGLETAPVDHPLMRTSFEVLRGWHVPAGAWQPEPWFAEILDKTVAIAPTLGPRLEIIR
ncbi:hypothetical protein [Jannaschia pohangensis]|uniref:Uncharacterized protein n=1 Tax=Jannaschia pohangensis TaxID=390807 RepID=A0A1I3P2Z7_9RHOB|nr:hypothetical protein [Jannaschia pohangensis]SFJ15707.1 hypothetical protein SAMN04488095_2326 [Jannaschia pohangensis]